METRWVAHRPLWTGAHLSIVTNGRELTTDAANARLGEALIATDVTTEAIAAIRRAIALNPENKDIRPPGPGFEASGSDTETIAECNGSSPMIPRHRYRQVAGARAGRAGRVDESGATVRASIARQPRADREQLLLRPFSRKFSRTLCATRMLSPSWKNY